MLQEAAKVTGICAKAEDRLARCLLEEVHQTDVACIISFYLGCFRSAFIILSSRFDSDRRG